MKTTFLALACVAAFPVCAQTVTTPARSITSQQETPGVDSTFQGDVQPNVQDSADSGQPEHLFQQGLNTPLVLISVSLCPGCLL